MPSLNVIAYILSEISQVNSSQVWDALHTQTRVIYLKICKCKQLVSPTGNNVSFDNLSKWSSKNKNYIIRLDTKSSLEKKALTEQTPHICLTWYARVTIIHDDTTGTDDFKLQYNFMWPTVAACLICIACLVNEIIQSWIYSSSKPLWPCIKVNVIETTMSIYPMQKSTFMQVWMPELKYFPRYY